MLQLIKSLNPEHYYPRTYIVANTDILSKEKAIEYEQSTGQQVGLFKIKSIRQIPFTELAFIESI